MTVDDLLCAATAKIGSLGIAQDPLSRVSAYPDIRTFRLYRAQKLVDPPHTKSGTAGVYGHKHVLQLVAIKSLQAQRLPLREIRRLLVSASEAGLEELIGGPPLDCRSPHPSTKRSGDGPTNKGTARWMLIQLAEGVLVMVDEEWVSRSRPSSLRALGEQVTSRLLSHRS